MTIKKEVENKKRSEELMNLRKEMESKKRENEFKKRQQILK